jgi:hypothetical protein
MKLRFVISLLATLSLAAFAQQPVPRMTTVEPPSAKAGAEVVVNGENLQKEHVAKLYLTDGKNDTPVVMIEQAAATIKFKIPEKAAAGRFSLMLLTTGNEPKLIEQPVRVTIEE